MSSSSLLNIGSRALAANMAALHVTGNNIANVNTPGYSRQTIQLESSGGQLSGNGFFGKGVEVATVQRAHSDYLTRQAVLTQSVAAADSTRSEKLALLEPIFASGDNGIGAGINNALNAFADVVSMPRDLSARQVVIARADEMTARLREASSRLDLLGEGLNEELRLGVEAVNSRASQIASLNSQISALQGSGHTPNDLLDQRDQLVSEINSYVNTTSIPSPDGSISVFVGGTQPLVLAGHSMKLSTDRDLFDPTKLGLAIETNAGPAALNDTQLTGGSVTGLLQFQRTDMVTARNQLGRLTLGTATLMNEQHRLGLDLKGNPGSDLFKLAALPDGLASSKNTGNATVSMAVADATAMAPSDYELRFESGTVDVVRLSDGQVTHVGGLPARVDGIDISLGGTPQVGDRFLLQPFSMAAGSIATAISSPTSLAVATPVTAVPGSTNKGDLAASALTATLADGNMTAPVQITFTGTSSFDVTGAGTGDPTGLTYVSGNAITFNGWTLKLTGTPQPGDTLQILPNSSGARNAGQAQGFLDLRDTPVFDGVSLSDGYASVLAEIGTRVQSAKLASGVSGAMAAQAVQSQSSVAGVNLDEEAARLLQFQQSYQAAARILQTAQSVFDSLMQGFR
jgi:flagellar hook-associated protein 1 FlgK